MPGDPMLPPGCTLFGGTVTVAFRCPKCEEEWEAAGYRESGGLHLENDKQHDCSACGEEGEQVGVEA